MARIPTYNSQQTQAVAQENIHVDSAISAAVSGAVAGVKQAADLTNALDKYNQAKEKEAYDTNTAPRMESITKSTVDLNAQNLNIRKSMAAAPNAQKANEQLEQRFSDIINNPPQNLDKRSLEDWRKTMESEKRRLQLQNLHWGETAAKSAGAAATKKANLELFDMRMKDARYSGLTHTGYSDGQIDIDGSGLFTERHMPALNPEYKKLQDQFHAQHFIGQAEVPLETSAEDPAIQGILGDNLDEVEGEQKSGWWIFGKEAKTKQQVGTEKINQYFDKVRENIDNSGLSKAEQNALKSYADAQQRARQREFETYIKASNLDLQQRMGSIPNPTFVGEYFDNKRAEQELELNPIRENRTVADIRADDYLSNLTFGNDFQSYASKFEYAPMGNVSDFSTELKTALATMNIPVGEYTREELYKKYAPGNSINERQAIETLIKDNPYIKITDTEDMNAANGFDESAWAHDVIQEIATMPSSTPEEKERKQAAVNHALYQAQKEINGGQGFQDNNLRDLFAATLTGNVAPAAQGGFMPFINNTENVKQIFGLARAMMDANNDYDRKQSWSVINQGVLSAIRQYQEDGDGGQFRNNLKKVNQEVLAQRYFGVVDINELQRKLENHEPAVFTYDDKPYEYLGFSGNDVYVKSGKTKTTLGE